MARYLPREERLTRYRLIVDAHAILSDDQKRSAYDSFGLGWALSSINRRFDSQSWKNTSKFICLVLVFLVRVTLAQTCVLLSSLAKLELQRKRIDEQCRDLIDRHRDRALGLSTLVAQMERLLLKRDPSGMGLAQEPFYRDMLPLCEY
ncbi:hypothetical protein N7445_003841 [Penicillium cf. griseofulvum]|nr:hypothetical protein N7445_003841 [Penicillium cf. griseofulvum]